MSMTQAIIAKPILDFDGAISTPITRFLSNDQY
jgi:hypothetical protein